MTVVGQRLRPARAENAAFDGINRLPGLAEFLFEQPPLHAAVDDADRDPFARGPGVVEQALRGQQGEQLVKDGGPRRRRRRVTHGRGSSMPVTVSSNARRLSTSRMQCCTAGEPWRTARTRMA